MTFWIRERKTDVAWFGRWPFPAPPTFIQSRAYDLLKREMARYVRGEVAGRSFLISGHRGSGKTALVRRSVEDLNQEILESTVTRADKIAKQAASPPDPSKEDPRERILALQRPLLIKLHGPSLLGPIPKAEPEAGKTGEKGGAADAGEGEASKKEGTAPKKDGKTPKNDDKASKKKGTEEPAEKAPATAADEADLTDRTAFALVQITIGLYRALTTEFGSSFANHARELRVNGRPGESTDYLELAAQFTLDLDNAPRAVLLRSYYERLGRLELGVLWPHEIAALLRPRLNNQGAREIVALATAAQAFEVCSGEISDKESRKEAQSKDESTETKVEAGLKDVANKILDWRPACSRALDRRSG